MVNFYILFYQIVLINLVYICTDSTVFLMKLASFLTMLFEQMKCFFNCLVTLALKIATLIAVAHIYSSKHCVSSALWAEMGPFTAHLAGNLQPLVEQPYSVYI